MKHFLQIGLSLAALLAVFCPGSAFGQVYPTQDGRALDVNLSTSPWKVDRISTPESQSQILDMADRVPNNGPESYSGNTDVKISLPSESLNDFRRNSVGIGDMSASGQYLPKPYYSPVMSSYLFGKPLSNSSVVSASGNLSQAYSSRRSRQVDNSYSTARSYVNYNAAPQNYLGDLSPSAVISMTIKSDYSASRKPLHSYDYGYRTDGSADAVTGARREYLSSLFGYVDSVGQDQLINQLSSDYSRQNLSQNDEPSSASGGSPGTDLSADQADVRQAAEDINAEADETADVFVSLIANMRDVQQSRDRYESLKRSPEQRSDSYTVAAVQIRGSKITSLGGSRPDRFNRLMRSGDRLLEKEDFYQAAKRYQVASNINPSNPLAPLGMMISYLGAGENYSASQYLRQVLRMYPDIVRISVDLQSMLGDELLARRIKQIQFTMDETSNRDANLLALLAFIRLNTGDTAAAVSLAGELAEKKGLSGEIAIFAGRISPADSASGQ